jgi:hypothetical protein
MQLEEQLAHSKQQLVQQQVGTPCADLYMTPTWPVDVFVSATLGWLCCLLRRSLLPVKTVASPNEGIMW